MVREESGNESLFLRASSTRRHFQEVATIADLRKKLSGVMARLMGGFRDPFDLNGWNRRLVSLRSGKPVDLSFQTQLHMLCCGVRVEPVWFDLLEPCPGSYRNVFLLIPISELARLWLQRKAADDMLHSCSSCRGP